MKRLHVSIAAEDFAGSVGFYTTLFGTGPTTERPGYAKWFLDDPRVNFVINEAAANRGVRHLGIQVDSDDELDEVAARLKSAEQPLLEQTQAHCCYHVSDKAWAQDPQGLTWETFHTTGEIPVAEADEQTEPAPSACQDTACCPGAAP